MSQAAMPTPSNAEGSAIDTRAISDELALAAARAQRRNQPRAFVVVAGLALLGAMVYAGIGWRSRAAAMDALAVSRDEDTKVRTALAKLDALKRAGAGSPNQSGSELPQTTIIELGREAGLSKPLGSTTPGTSPANSTQGWSQTTYLYTVKDPSIDAVLRWMELVQERMPGMGINKLTVRPEATEWSVTVEFARWTKPDAARGGAATGGGRTP